MATSYESIPTINQVKDDLIINRQNIKLFACNVSIASLGWHDACPGALIPYIQEYYGINYQVVSAIFIASFIGYVTASLLNVTFTRWIGMAKVITLGAAIQGVGSIIIILGLPFEFMAISYAVCGFGLALQDAQLNTYVARLEDASFQLGVVHAVYGVSGMLAPIVATSFILAGIQFPLFYFTNLSWSILSIIFLSWGFKFEPDAEEEDIPKISSPSLDTGHESLPLLAENRHVSRHVSLFTAIKSRIVWTTLLFIILYVGAEVGEAGWIVSYLLVERDGGKASGYASSGFFLGLTISRVVLVPLNRWLGERRITFVYLLLSLIFQITVWVSPNFIVDVVAIIAFGFMMGPLYPIALHLVTQSTPRSYHTAAIGLMACLGQAGSALFPFAVGSLAETFGVKVLLPVEVIVLGIMILAWTGVPSGDPHYIKIPVPSVS